MIHSNNTDGSQTFTDTASGTTEVGGKTLTANGQVQHDTSFYKFAISGVSFDGTGDYISTPTHSAWEFGTGDFGIGFWLRLTKDSDSILISNHSGVPAVDNWYFQYKKTGNGLAFYNYPGASEKAVAWAPSLDTWYHIEVSRSGTGLYFFVDGVQVGATQNVTGWDLNVTTSLAIGCGANGSTQPLSGHLDEIIIKKGAALHTAAFTPPTLPYCD
uniref:Putative baseplate wedge initiator n=1 Tax=viral metagenome TaxID=1070528 RepID=A0A6H1ZL21_9ZZZZ